MRELSNYYLNNKKQIFVNLAGIISIVFISICNHMLSELEIKFDNIIEKSLNASIKIAFWCGLIVGLLSLFLLAKEIYNIFKYEQEEVLFEYKPLLIDLIIKAFIFFFLFTTLFAPIIEYFIVLLAIGVVLFFIFKN